MHYFPCILSFITHSYSFACDFYLSHNVLFLGLEHNFNKYDDSFVTDLNTPYDYESIMHYRPFAFNKDPSIPTITTNIPEFFNIIGQYLDFSEMDVVRLNRMYNCCRLIILILTHMIYIQYIVIYYLFSSASSLTLLDQCAFENINICGMVQSLTDDADWVHLKSSPGSEDHTLGGLCRGYTSTLPEIDIFPLWLQFGQLK